MILHLATLDTRNFQFQALGLTEQEARATLEQAGASHAAETGAWEWAEFSDGVNVSALEIGTAYRDGWPLLPVLEREQPATSPAEEPDLSAVLDPSDLSALMLGRPVHVEGWSPDDPHGMPAAIVRLSYDDNA